MFKGLGGMGDMMGLMKKAQQMKKDMKKIKDEISKTNITVSDKSKILSIIVNGDYIVQKVSFSEGFNISNTKNLELIIKETFNIAVKEVKKISSEKMSLLTKQGLPADFNF